MGRISLVRLLWGLFPPYPQYAGPAFWLTDYLIATTLQEAYQERMEASIQASAYAGRPGRYHSRR